MKKQISKQKKKIYIGCDVSKGYADFCILTENKELAAKDFQLDDTYEGHRKLQSIIKDIFNKNPEIEIYAAVESTGGYENNWYKTLKKLGDTCNLKITRLNPYGVHLNQKAGMKRNVTDAISAFNIAEYLIEHSNKVQYRQDDTLATLRHYWNLIKMYKKQRKELINQLEIILYNANPTLMQYRKGKLHKWFIELIILYPTATDIANANVEDLTKIPNITISKAEKLIAEAKQSVACSTDAFTKRTIIEIASQIKTLDETIKNDTDFVENELKKSKKFGDQIEILKSFIGINTVSAIGILLEIGSIERFKSVKAICCYFGLHPKFKQSGDKTSGVHMSKQGSKTMREILFNITKCAIVYNPVIKTTYEKKLSEGMSKMAAIGVCMHKTLRIIYGMLKHMQKFNPDIDKLNAERSAKKIQNKKNLSIANTIKVRRYQPFDPSSPISRKQNKKRKELNLSQCESNPQITGSKNSFPVSS